MKIINKVVLAVLATVSVASMAATDGTAGGTSTGTFINSLGNVASPVVRVFGLKDAVMVSTTPVISTLGGNPGVTDSFCVAHSLGGNVKVMFSSTGLTTGGPQGAVAINSVTGGTMDYGLYAGNSLATGTALAGKMGPTTSVTVTAAPTDTSATATCTTGNVFKSIIRGGSTAGPTSGIWTDTVTVTASPI